jgi:hypothetical protein
MEVEGQGGGRRDGVTLSISFLFIFQSGSVVSDYWVKTGIWHG